MNDLDDDLDDSEYRSATSSADSQIESKIESQTGPEGGGGEGVTGVVGDDAHAVGYHMLRSGASLDPRRHQRYFTLRVETCSPGTGRFLGALFWLLMICFLLYGTAVIVLSSLDGSGSETQVSNSYYASNMIILSVALGLVVLMSGIFVYRLNSALTRGGRTWRKRQPYLLWDAAVVSTLTIVDLCCVVTAYALYTAAECFPSETALVVLGFVRMVTFTGVVAWMTTTATLMQVIHDDLCVRGRGDPGVGVDGTTNVEGGAILDITGATGTTGTTGANGITDARRVGTAKMRLMVDEPISVILRKRWYVAAFYLTFAVVSLVVLVLRVMSVDAGVNNIPPKMSCGADKLEPYECASNTVSDIIAYAVMATVLMGLWACYVISVRLAWRSQKDLPNGRFRISKLFLRIQMRYGRLLFFAILFTGLLVELATIGTCRGRINAMLGSPAAHMSLAVYSCTLLFLYAPGTERSESVSMFKSIAWREDDVPLLLDELKACQEDRYAFLVIK